MSREKQTERSSGAAIPAEQPPLSPHRAFVVQFRAGAGVEPGPFAGRVEHIVSGHATHFHSQEELLAFIAQVLANMRE